MPLPAAEKNLCMKRRDGKTMRVGSSTHHKDGGGARLLLLPNTQHLEQEVRRKHEALFSKHALSITLGDAKHDGKLTGQRGCITLQVVWVR
jgi:hypothetical protein